MPKSKELKIELPSVDELFTTQEERDEAMCEVIKNLPLSKISDFPNHPFKVKEDEKMMELIESVSAHGVLAPVLVRPKGNGYEMISGHRRKYASHLVGMMEIPCIIRDLSDDEATILLVDSNLQREEILPSERAFAYKMKMEALRHQGKRTDLTSCQLGTKLKGTRSDENLAKEAPDSARQIQRYIRLTELIQPLLDMVDEKKIVLTTGVMISYLKKDEQEQLFDSMQYEDCTPSGAQAKKMKEFSEQGKLNENVILSILQEEKPNQVEKIKIPKERISKFFPKGTPEKKIEETIVKALELYQKRERQKQSAR